MIDVYGADHRVVAARLAARVDALATGARGPRIIVLEGGPGCGKSEIIRRLYDHLVQRQGAGGYWPAREQREDIRTAGAEAGAIGRRKSLGPSPDEVGWNQGALPGMWWVPFACRRQRPTDPLGLLECFEGGLGAHALPAALAAAAYDSEGDNAAGITAAWSPAVRRALREGGMAPALAVLGAAADLSPAVLPTVDMITQWAELLHRRPTLSRQFDRLTPRPLPGRLAEILSQCARPGLPVIVAIEDLHLLDEAASQLLTEIGNLPASHPVIVVASARPEMRLRSHYRDWLTTAVSSGQAAVWPSPNLTQNDRLSIWRELAPKAASDVIAMLATWWRDPLSLTLGVAELQRLQVLRGPSIDMLPEEVARLPRRPHDLLRRTWARLPGEVRRGLQVAAVAVGDSSAWSSRFSPDVAARLAPEGAGESPAAILRGLTRAASPYGWLESLPDGGLAFAEQAVYEIAADEAARTWNLTQRRRSLAAQRAEVCRRVRLAPTNQVAEAYALLYAQNPLPPTDHFQEQAAVRTARFLAQRHLEAGQPELAYQTLAGAPWRTAWPPDHHEPIAISFDLARLLVSLGREDEAAQLYGRPAADAGVVQEGVRVQFSQFAARWAQLRDLTDEGRFAEAVRTGESLLRQLESLPPFIRARVDASHLGQPSDGIDIAVSIPLRIHFTYLRALAGAGRGEEAWRAAAPLLAGARATLGPDPIVFPALLDDLIAIAMSTGRPGPAVLAAEASLRLMFKGQASTGMRALERRGRLALAYQRAGRTADGLLAARAALGRALRHPDGGPHHPVTVTTAARLASILLSDGQRTEAAMVLQGAVEAATEVKDEPTRRLLDSMTKDSNRLRMGLVRDSDPIAVAAEQWSRGETDRAMTTLRQAVSLVEPHLDPTLFADLSAHLGEALVRLEEPGQAVSVFATAHEQLEQAGCSFEQEPRLDLARREVGVLLAVGNHCGARETCERLIDAYRALGAGYDGEALQTMALYATVLDAQGDGQGAIDTMDEVWHALERIKGPHDPLTTGAGLDLFRLLTRHEQWKRAVATGQDVLGALVSIHGFASEICLQTASSIAKAARADGQYETAFDYLHRVWNGWTELSGPQAPEAVEALAELPAILLSEQRYAEALDFDQLAIPALVSLHGDDAPAVLAARQRCATTLEALGRFDEAAQMRALIVASHTRIDGPTSAVTLKARLDLVAHLARTADASQELSEARQIVADCEQALDPGDPVSQAAKRTLIALLWEAGQAEEAVASARDLLAASEALHGELGVQTLTCANLLAESQWRAGDVGGAVSLARDTWERWNLAELQETEGAMLTLSVLSGGLAAAGNPAEALELAGQSVQLADAGVGGPAATAQVLHNAGLIEFQSGGAPDAIALLTRAYDLRFETLGPAAVDTLATAKALSGALLSVGNLEEAGWLCRRQLAALEHEPPSAWVDEARQWLMTMLLAARPATHDEHS